MSQINRIDGGLIDQEKVLNFTFNGQILKGYEGDTLASALLANNKHLIGRSFKYHRPRGIVTAGSEEQNAIKFRFFKCLFELYSVHWILGRLCFRALASGVEVLLGSFS